MFENIQINKKSADMLSEAVHNDHLSHAIILEGAREEIRTAAANELAMAVLCQGGNKPCLTCKSCKKALTFSHPDIHRLRKDEKSASIKVDEIRLFREKARLLPNDSDKSVFVIYEAQDMGIQAQNALLKIFEEPSAHVCFILTCESKSALLETIISRASSYSLQISCDESRENDEAAMQTAAKLLTLLCTENEAQFLLQTGIFIKDKLLLSEVFKNAVLIFRDALILQNGLDCIVSGQFETAKLLSCNFSETELIEYIKTVNSLSDELKANANNNLLVTRFCSCLYRIKNR